MAKKTLCKPRWHIPNAGDCCDRGTVSGQEEMTVADPRIEILIQNLLLSNVDNMDLHPLRKMANLSRWPRPYPVSEEKAAVGSWDRFASADQTILAASMPRKDWVVGRKIDSVSELLYEARFTDSNIFIEYNSWLPMDGRNPQKSLWAEHILVWFVVSCFWCLCFLHFIVPMLKLTNVIHYRFVL